MSYVPKSSKTGSHRRSLSKSKSLNSLNSRYKESAKDQKQELEKKKDKEYAKYDKILNAIHDEDFQDVDLKNSLGRSVANIGSDYNVDDLKKLHDSLQQPNRSVKYRSSSSNLRASTASLSSLGSPSLSMPKKFHNGSIADSSSSSVNNFGGLMSSNSSVSSLTNNASYVRGLGINKSQIRRPSDNLTNLKNKSQSFDSKSDSISSSLASVNESDYETNEKTTNKQRIEEQITIPNALSKPAVSSTSKKLSKTQKPHGRPFSDDSMISSASSNFDFDGEYDSRISSFTSMENVSQLSSPDDQIVYHDKPPKVTETPEFMNEYRFENYDYSLSTSRTVSVEHKYTHQRNYSSHTDNTLQISNEVSRDINDTFTINNSSTTIDSSNTILEHNDYQSNSECGSSSTVASPKVDTDARTRQNTLLNAQNASASSLNIAKRRTSGPPRVKSLNRVSSMPAMHQLPASKPPYGIRTASLQQVRRSSNAVELNSGQHGSVMSIDTTVSSPHLNGSPMVSPNGDVIVSPGQKYRLRRQLSKKNLQAFRKEISKINTKDEVIDVGAPDSIFFNIPYASGSAATLFSNNNTNKQRSTVMKKVFNESQTSIPISPLINNTGKDGEFANNLSKFYTDASDSFVANELAKREENFSKLPSYIMSQLESQSSVYSLSPRSSVSFESKSSNGSGNPEILSPLSAINSPISQASNHTIDELRLMSPEKIEHLLSTRPMWLPPKSSQENVKHQQQISEVFENYSKKEIYKKEKSFQKLKGLLVNNQKWFEMTVKHPEIHKPVIYSMRHLCWKTSIPNDLRYKVWGDVLHYYNIKNGFEDPQETFDSLQKKLSTINIEYLEPEVDLIISALYPKLELFQEGQKLNQPLKKLLLFKKISTAGLQYGDEVLFALFLLYFSDSEAFELVSLINDNVLNETFTTKYNNNVSNNYVMKKYLEKHFKDEFPLLNARNLYKVFIKIDPELLIKIFDILILNNTYKVCYCFMLLVLKFYHFGFIDLKQLTINDKMFIDVDDHDEFFDKFHYYFKKF